MDPPPIRKPSNPGEQVPDASQQTGSERHRINQPVGLQGTQVFELRISSGSAVGWPPVLWRASPALRHTLIMVRHVFSLARLERQASQLSQALQCVCEAPQGAELFAKGEVQVLGSTEPSGERKKLERTLEVRKSVLLEHTEEQSKHPVCTLPKRPEVDIPTVTQPPNCCISASK